MNLNTIAGAAVSAVNPWSLAQYSASTGATTVASGRRSPSYAAAVPVRCQVQALTFKDLTQLQGINLAGEARAIYVDGDWRSVSRPAARGGDMITLEDGRAWLVVHVLENWHDVDGWCKVACVLQVQGVGA